MLEATGLDKVLHVLVSYILALINPGLAAIAGMAKEIWDYTRTGAIDGYDLVADALGIVLATGQF